MGKEAHALRTVGYINSKLFTIYIKQPCNLLLFFTYSAMKAVVIRKDSSFRDMLTVEGIEEPSTQGDQEIKLFAAR